MKMDVKKAIKKHLREQSFQTVTATAANISLTEKQLRWQKQYYIERKKDGMLVLNKKDNHLTLYIEKKQTALKP